MENPIKENRIVKDKTFALRLLGFALDVDCADACSEDEKESMISYATSLLKYQIKTATEKDELDYLERCNAKEKLKKGLMFLGHGMAKLTYTTCYMLGGQISRNLIK